MNREREAFVLVELLRGEGHGAELSERMFTHSEGQVSTHESMSRQLKRMEVEGLLVSHKEPSANAGGSGRPRTVYALTPVGREHALRAWAGLRALLGNPPEGLENTGEAR